MPLILAKSVGRAKTEKNKTKKCDEKLHINGLFCQLVVLTLQCCCVSCASRQANQWLLTVNPSLLEKKNTKKSFFVYLCCVMSVLNLNSLLSNILNYWRVLFLYAWCTFHWLKLWSLQSRGWNRGLGVEHLREKGNIGAKRHGEDLSCVRWGFLWRDLEDFLKWWRIRMYVRRLLSWRSFTCRGREWRLKFRLSVEAPDCVLVVSTLVFVIEISHYPWD